MKKKASLIVSAVAIIAVLLLGAVIINVTKKAEEKQIIKMEQNNQVLQEAKSIDRIKRQVLAERRQFVEYDIHYRGINTSSVFKALDYIDTGQEGLVVSGEYIEDS